MRRYDITPEAQRIERIVDEASDIKTFVLSFSGAREVRPGQFLEVYVPGYWEIPISVASVEEGKVLLTVARVGKVTGALFGLREGDIIGLRGPYGKPWPLELLKDSSVLMVVGGLGLAPLRMLIEEHPFGKLTLLLGARTPELLLYRERYGEWERRGVDIRLTVDTPSGDWKGNVGVVTTLLERELVESSDFALVAGPPIMMKFTLKMLEDFGMDLNRIYLTLENHMKCGVGLCGHCRIGNKYVCVDGPVFSADEIEKLARWASGEVL